MSTAKLVQTEADAFWYLNLTIEQKKALHEFTSHLKATKVIAEEYDDCYTMLRFLKARQWDVKRATTMYEDMLRWRADEGIDALLGSFVEYPEYDELSAVYPHFYHKTDKFGRPLYIELIGRTDPAKLLALSPMDRFMKYHIFCWERLQQQLLPACSHAAGKPIVTNCVIVDLLGLSLKNFTLTAQHLLKAVAKVDQDYYPEHLGQMFIINTPMIFKAIWAVVSPMLEERTRKKIVVLGADYKSTLLEVIPEENLPTMFGGNSVCPCTRLSIGAWSEEQDGVSMSPGQWAATLANMTPPASRTPSLGALSEGGKSELDGVAKPAIGKSPLGQTVDALANGVGQLSAK